MSNKPLFVQWCAQDILTATELMSDEEELAYRRIIDWIYATNGELRDNDQILARITKAGRKWKAIKKSLISQGKLEVKDGLISNLRCELELAKARHKTEQAKAAANTRHERDKELKENETDDAGAYAGENAGAHANAGANADANAHAGDHAGRDANRKPYSVPKGTGDSASPDPLKTLFDFGVSVLTAADVKPRDARSLVGKWRAKLRDDRKLMQILMTAREQAAVDPVAYIERALAGPARPLSMAEKFAQAEARKRAAS